MTHLTPGNAHATPGRSGAATTRHLDRDRLSAGITSRRQRLADLEADLAAACEAAAARGAPTTIRVDNRETWDGAMWRRYLAAAAVLETTYGPEMRRLLQEIDQLQRLIDLPLAA